MALRRWVPAVAALAVILAGFGCGGEKAEQGQAVARVGGKTITEGDMQARLEEMPPFMKQQLSTPDGRRRLLDALIEEEMVYKEAVASGLDKTEEFRKELDKTRREILIRDYYEKVIEAKATPSDAEVKQYYEANPAEFAVPAGVNVRHIMVTTPEEAARLARQIEQGADFAALARKYSVDPSTRNTGGLISTPVQKGAAIKGLGALPEFVDAAFALEAGRVSGPVKTTRGYHLIKAESIIPEGRKSLEEARADIVSKMQYSKRKTVREETLNELKAKYKVSYVTETAQPAKTPEEFFKLASEAPGPKEKIIYYEQFLKAFPQNERAYEAKFMIGFTLAEELKDFDGAEKVFKEFLEKYPSTDLSDDATWMLANMRSGAQPDLEGK
jgi:peptidyl-prolyl cis-trans isomerase C